MSGIKIDEGTVRSIISDLRLFNDNVVDAYNLASNRFNNSNDEWQDVQSQIVEGAFQDVYANITSGVQALNEYVDHLEQKLNALVNG